MRSILSYTIVTLLSVIAGLYLFEGYMQYQVYKAEPIVDIARGAVARVVQAREGKEIYAPAKGHDALPFTPLARAPGYWTNCVEGKYAEWQAGPFGFRNDSALWSEAPVDLVTIGDSFTEGVCVHNDETIAAYLGALGDKRVNLGIAGADFVHELAIMREFVPHLRPRKVFWLYYEENDLQAYLPSAFRQKYLEDPTFSQQIVQREQEIKQAYADSNRVPEFLKQYAGIETQDLLALEEKRVRKERQDYRFGRFLRLEFTRRRFNLFSLVVDSFEVTPEAYKAFDRALGIAKQQAARDGAEFYFVYLPTVRRYSSAAMRDYHDRNRQKVLAIVEGHQLPLIDTVDLFDRSTFGQYFAYGEEGGHFNAAGYKAVAERILAYFDGSQ